MQCKLFLIVLKLLLQVIYASWGISRMKLMSYLKSNILKSLCIFWRKQLHKMFSAVSLLQQFWNFPLFSELVVISCREQHYRVKYSHSNGQFSKRLKKLTKWIIVFSYSLFEMPHIWGKKMCFFFPYNSKMGWKKNLNYIVSQTLTKFVEILC